MNVLLLTIFISLVLALFFIGMFVLQANRGAESGGSAERDSLLPLDDGPGTPGSSENHRPSAEDP